MKILILGGEGMIGNGLAIGLSGFFEVAITVIKPKLPVNKNIKVYENVNGLDISSIIKVINDFKPDVVINAIGIVKQKYKKGQESEIIKLNSVLPFELQAICELNNSKLILLSTDCVFTGEKGNYSENDLTDALDIYGKTKILGELTNYNNVLTVRISSIGLEINSSKGLIEWFLSQKGEIKGFDKAIYSGFTSKELSKIFKFIFENHNNLNGLYHISSNPISKYELLSKLKILINKKDITIQRDSEFFCDRSLNSEKFKKLTGYIPTSWDVMLKELSEDILARNQNGSI
ncbi:MAG: SDR family oxidoreductase [Leptospiraceae bacterium]|nr:SDR family oxidoreductase [Leptospiraceae bacterium]